jgi:hypothetical protein
MLVSTLKIKRGIIIKNLDNGSECSTQRNNSIGTTTVQKTKKRGPLNFRPFKKSFRNQQLC